MLLTVEALYLQTELCSPVSVCVLSFLSFGVSSLSIFSSINWGGTRISFLFISSLSHSSLLTAYERCSTEAEKEKLLSSVRYGKLNRSVGQHWIFMAFFF